MIGHTLEIVGARTITPDGQVLERTRTKTQKPSQWHVVIINDDYTPMDFVVFALMKVFRMAQKDAEALTFKIHVDGKGIAGTYTYEVAETKLIQLLDLAKDEKHPLQATLECAPDA